MDCINDNCIKIREVFGIPFNESRKCSKYDRVVEKTKCYFRIEPNTKMLMQSFHI